MIDSVRSSVRVLFYTVTHKSVIIRFTGALAWDREWCRAGALFPLFVWIFAPNYRLKWLHDAHARTTHVVNFHRLLSLSPMWSGCTRYNKYQQ